MVSIYCSCKGHRLSSQHPHSSLQLKVQLQGIKLTPGLLRHQACTWHTHIHPSIHTHQIEINLKRDVDFKEGWGCSAVQWQNARNPGLSLQYCLKNQSSRTTQTQERVGERYANSRGLSLGKQGEGGSSHLTPLPHF